MTTHCGEWRGAPEVAARLGRRGLEAVFRPRSIAVIGASRHRGSVGAEIFHNLLARGFQGVVYPVNPRAEAVQSVRAWPTVESLPEVGAGGRRGRACEDARGSSRRRERMKGRRR